MERKSLRMLPVDIHAAPHRGYPWGSGDGLDGLDGHDGQVCRSTGAVFDISALSLCWECYS